MKNGISAILTVILIVSLALLAAGSILTKTATGVVSKSSQTAEAVLLNKSDHATDEKDTISTVASSVAPIVTTDKVDYNPEEVVTITGSGFQPNAEVKIEVLRPDGGFDLLNVSSDGEGAFVATYQLDATAGPYFVKVYDGTNGTDTKFMMTSQSATPEVTVTATIATDEVEYDPGEVVTIKGSGFQPNAMVNIEIVRPDGNFDSWTVNSDGEGFLVTAYQPDAIAGPYFVKVYDGINGTETKFMIISQTTIPEATVSPVIITDKPDYNRGEVVTIRGSDFQPNAEVNVEVIRPDGSFDLWIVNSDGEGVFVTTYQLDATAGLCFVKASDGINGTETKFMIISQTTIPEGTLSETFGIYLLKNNELVISDDDIIWYNWSSHEIKLSPEGVKKMQALNAVDVIHGEPFVLKIGDQEIYKGSFWTPISSIGFNGIAIETFVRVDNTIKLQNGYPIGSLQNGDLRNDPRILDHFQKLGKLEQ